MGETKWTEEQLAAIETRKCNLLIAAAAGSGKTAVLVERIIRIITNEDDPVDIDRLLVVTFTSAAASEMRERIAGAITKALEKTPSSKNLQKQLTLLSRANIMTMHSFCLDVIRNNFHVINLDPGFRILDETEGVLLKGEVIDELFEDKYEEEDSEFLKLVEAYSGSRDDRKLKDIILDLYRFSMSGPWPEKWLKEKAEDFNILNKEELSKSKWVQVLKENLEIEIKGLVSMVYKAIDICNNTEGLEPYLENLELDKFALEEVCESLDKDLDIIHDKLFNISFSKLKTIKKTAVEDENIKESVKSIRNDVKKKVVKIKEDIFSVTPSEMLEIIQKSYHYMKELTNLVIEFQDRFLKAKKDKGSLDFNDLEHLCLEILTNEEVNIKEKYKDYFDEILVDEYQDSNSVQEAIIDLVSRKNSDDPNVFMVGDVKQSIYRFRQAKPELFLEKYSTYSKSKGKNRKIQLYKNFRSRFEVINGVNFIFKELMSKVVGELNYTEEEALNLGANYKLLEEDGITGGDVELHVLDKSSEYDKSDEEESVISEDTEDVGGINLEARIIAKRIKKLLSRDEQETFNVLDKETGEYRPVTYKDIVIMLRATKNWSEIFLDELGSQGIPVYSDTGSGYFESIEIRTIMSLLKVIDNPMQDVPLIALLRSPIINFSVEELANIRLINKESYFYENIKLICADEYEENNLLKEKCLNFINKLNEWRDRSVYTPIDELIWYLYMDTAYYGYIGAMPNGLLRQANLRILFQRAEVYEKTSFKGLFNFINFINRLRKSSGDMGSAKVLGENEDVVRIMSIHKSKGLEFPVVFLAGAGKQFNLMDLNKNILYHEELGLGPELIDLEKRVSYSTLPKEAIKQRIKLETLSEEMRILYVAFTRAKEKLIITGSTSDLEKWSKKCCNSANLDKDVIQSSEVLKGKSYLDWIGMALAKHEDGKKLRELSGITDIYRNKDLSIWNINFWKKSELINEKTIEIIDEKRENNLFIKSKCEVIDDEIKRRLEFRYRFKEVTNIKSNFSVSDVKKKNYEELDTNEGSELYKYKLDITPKFLKEEKGITSAEKGTAIHFVMQSIDFNRVNTVSEIKEQLNELVKRELLSEVEFRAINERKIFNFFVSNLGKRLIKSFKSGSKVYRELPFYTEISPLEVDGGLSENIKDEKVRLQGVIDCFFYEGDNIVLLDYKTDYVQTGNEEDMIKKYSIQIKYYKEALEKITGKKVLESYLYLFYLDKEIRI
jgi:ATP-dependent helicase/nuclease subunit A